MATIQCRGNINHLGTADSATHLERETKRLCELYEIDERNGSATEEEDDGDLTKICLFESDVGFICAAEAVAEGFSKRNDGIPNAFYQLFDLPNPFHGYLPPERYTTHSWDIWAHTMRG